jgi:hypothetical protein
MNLRCMLQHQSSPVAQSEQEAHFCLSDGLPVFSSVLMYWSHFIIP